MDIEYIKVSIVDGGIKQGWVEVLTYSLDSSMRGNSFWRLTGDDIELMVAHDFDITSRIDYTRAKTLVKKALARKERYSIFELCKKH